MNPFFIIGIVAFILCFVYAFRWIIREIRTDKMEAYIRALARIAEETEARELGLKWATETVICPQCQTKSGLLNWVQDGMEVRGNYCDDSYAWPAAHMKDGTYHGRNQENALLEIGRRLKRSPSA